MKIIFALISIILLTSCTGNNMEPIDFKDQKPRLIIEEYLSGNVKAWGILQNRSGKVTRQFSADLNGKWDGKQLILNEKFNKKWDMIKEQGFDLTFKRMWQFYLSYCEAGFKSKNIDLIQFSLCNK